MTANPVRTRQLDIARLTLRAWQLAAQGTEYQELDEPQGALARDMLEIILDELQNEGYSLRSLDFETVAVEEGESIVLLPNTVLRTTGTAMYVTSSGAELPVEPMSHEQWQVLSAKLSVSMPTRYMEQIVGDQVQVRFWPIPVEDASVRFRVQRLLGDNNDATKTPDAERGMNAFLLWELAHHLSVAKSMPIQRCGYLANIAATKRKSARMASNENVGFSVQIAHSTAWSR